MSQSTFSQKPAKRIPAVVISYGLLHTLRAKTTHGLIRGSDRFELLGVIDERHAGQDAGLLLDGQQRDIPVYASLQVFERHSPRQAACCIIGVAFPGGGMPAGLLPMLEQAIDMGMDVVNGLHEYLRDKAELVALAQKRGVQLIDLRYPKSQRSLRCWTGAVRQARCRKIAVLGTDIIAGKRTSMQLLCAAARKRGIHTEMIYTGQTGWMQGIHHGFILDATPNGYVSGELEGAILNCWNESRPELLLIEGQAALRNPSGPCGAELLLSADLDGVLLQHLPGRQYYQVCPSLRIPIPPLESEVALIRAYGGRVLGIALNGQGLSPEALGRYQQQLQQRLQLPVCRPLEEGVDALLDWQQLFGHIEKG